MNETRPSRAFAARLAGRIRQRFSQAYRRWQINNDIRRLVRQVSEQSPLRALAKDLQSHPQGVNAHPREAAGETLRPVALFNASTRLTGVSLNAAYSLLTSLGLQMAGIPVVRFACRAGMSRCVLGTQRSDLQAAPPCRACIAQSEALYRDAPTVWFRYAPEPALAQGLQGLSLEALERFEFPITLPGLAQGSEMRSIPLGRLVLPGIRWVLRRHHLPDEPGTRALYAEYILSAYRLAQEFGAFLHQVEPSLVVVFNGMFFPEATARWIAQQVGLRVVTHEVGLQPTSAFFTLGEATAYPLPIPADFQLTPAQDAELDAYLSQRMQGNFSMAGVQFWPEMRGLDPAFLERAAQFRQVVPVFTNVIFDTSQPHSNVVFPHMFAWLDVVLETARRSPDTLFVLRAHPDEKRAGKESRESVAEWVERSGAASLPNLVFFDAEVYVSSYQLIQLAKFVMVYNSTIGLEAAISGAAVLCAGRARFTQLPTVYFPLTQAAYRQQLDEMLAAASVLPQPEFQANARRFLYYQLYRSSLSFASFLEPDGIWQGFVHLKKFGPPQLTVQASPALRVVVEGVQRASQLPMPANPAGPTEAELGLFIAPQ